MLISTMKSEECREFLARHSVGRLACARDRQPYIVPIYFAYESDQLYGFTTPGQKVEWMRANPLVCVEADEVLSQENWTSVVVLGRYEELPEIKGYSEERNKARSLLVNHASWWETAYVTSVVRGQTEPPVPVFYRIHITEITGRRASPENPPV